MMKGYKVRLFPNYTQEKYFYKHISACRIVYNLLLNYSEKEYKEKGKTLSLFEMKKVACSFKYLEGYEWLNEISSQTIRNVSKDLYDAYMNFFKKRAKHPTYHKKEDQRPVYSIGINNLHFKNSYVFIPIIGKVKYKTKLDFIGNNYIHCYNPRISFTGKKWILSFAMEEEQIQKDKKDISIGIDLGIKETATISDGTNHYVFHNINKSRQIRILEEKIKITQRSLSRKYLKNKDKTNNIIKEEKKLKYLYNKINNIRINYIHQMISKIIDMQPKRIVVENLDIQNMMKNKYMTKKIQDQKLALIISIIKYKCEWNNIEFIQADKYFASSKICSQCGFIKKDLKLSDRIYCCKECGLTIDRDINAAINLSKYKV